MGNLNLFVRILFHSKHPNQFYSEDFPTELFNENMIGTCAANRVQLGNALLIAFSSVMLY